MKSHKRRTLTPKPTSRHAAVLAELCFAAPKAPIQVIQALRKPNKQKTT